MPARSKIPANSKESSVNIGFEAKLRLAADKLRNNMDAAEYKQILLGLIFLKYISDSFDEHHAKLVAGQGDLAGANPEDKDEPSGTRQPAQGSPQGERGSAKQYRAANVFWVPVDARWPQLQSRAKLPRLKGALNENYERADLDKHRFVELIDLIGSIDLARSPSPLPSPSGRGRSAAEGEGAAGLLDARPPAGFDPATAALFPDLLEDSALGHIPKGWKAMPLPEAVEVNPRRTLKSGTVAPYLEMKNLPTQGHSADEVVDREFTSGTKIQNGDTLLARITPCLENGKTSYVDFLEDGQVGWGSTEYIVLAPKPPLPPQFGYLHARSYDLRTQAIQNMTGTSGRQRVPSDCFEKFLLAVPPPAIARRFDELTAPLMAKIKANSTESRTLATLRNTLLPKLLSGELNVADTAKEVSA